MKVLLFSNDLMPFGELPTSGGGLRCWQLYQGLLAHGYEVVVSMPAFTYLTEKHWDKIPPTQRELLWNWETQDLILQREKPDAVLFASNWDHFNLSRCDAIPLIIDLHGSRLIETTMWNTPVDTERKIKILSQADCLLSAGERQRLYFYGWLLQAGRVPEDEHFIRFIPISLAPKPEGHDYSVEGSEDYPLIVSGGGWFPWQNQAQAIFAACNAIAQRQRGRLEIFGTPHEGQGDSSEEREIREIYRQVSERAKSDSRIAINGYISRLGLLEIYRKSSVALECMQYNLERELAFTTRTVEYLWCGLPVLYNNYAELSDYISEYDAGWCVDPKSEGEIAAALEEIFESPEIVRRKSQNALRLVSERFSWDKTILPLVEFLQNPKKQENASPALGIVSARASFLQPRGNAVDVPLRVGESVRQCLVMPADNISTIEVGVALRSEEARREFDSLELSLKSANGRSISARVVQASDVPASGSLSLAVPLLLRPRGGTALQVCLRLKGRRKGGGEVPSALAPVIARGLLEEVYPLVKSGSHLPKGVIARVSGGVVGISGEGQETEIGCLALRFIPGTGRVYGLRLQVERAVVMLKQGQWQRLAGAVRRRVPMVLESIGVR